MQRPIGPIFLFTFTDSDLNSRNHYGTARVTLIPCFMFQGGLVDPRLRASDEHIPIVRVPRAGGQPVYPPSF
jgi:hypothetical protein